MSVTAGGQISCRRRCRSGLPCGAGLISPGWAVRLPSSDPARRRSRVERPGGQARLTPTADRRPPTADLPAPTVISVGQPAACCPATEPAPPAEGQACRQERAAAGFTCCGSDFWWSHDRARRVSQQDDDAVRSESVFVTWLAKF